MFHACTHTHNVQATMAGIQGCGGHQNPPNIDIWKPTALNTSQWVEGMTNLGAKYAVLVVKHG